MGEWSFDLFDSKTGEFVGCTTCRYRDDPSRRCHRCIVMGYRYWKRRTRSQRRKDYGAGKERRFGKWKV